MTWYVARKADGTLASIHRDHMEGYNDEALADNDPVIAAFVAATTSNAPPTPRQWLERLAPATQLAVHAAALKDATGQTLLWLNRALGQPAIDVTLQETKDGVAALVSSGILTASDQTTLLAP